MLQSNHEIKKELLDYYGDDTNYEPNNDGMKLAGIQSLYDSNFKFVHESHKDEGLNEYESFPKGGKLKKHMHLIHEKHKDHRCESFGELFSQTIYRVHKCEKTSLKSQVESVHEKERYHKYEKCDKIFTLKKNLGHKDYKCESCGKSVDDTVKIR